MNKLHIKLILLIAFPSISVSASEQDKNTNVYDDIIRVVGTNKSGVELSSKKILSVPGTGNEPLKALESLPGVVLADGQSPTIRGSSPRDIYYQADGSRIGTVFHNDGTSTIHPDLIKSFELKAGAWEPQFSDSIGGVVDIKLRDPNPSELSGSASLSFLKSGALVESKIGDNSAFYLAARQSLVHLYIDLVSNDDESYFNDAPKNNDYQFKLITYQNDNNKLTIQATGAYDNVGLMFNNDSVDLAHNPDLSSGVDINQRSNNQSINWQTSSTIGDISLMLNRLKLIDDIKIGDIIDVKTDITDYSLKATNSNVIAVGAVEVGAEISTQKIDYVAFGKNSPCNYEFEVCPPTYLSQTISQSEKIDIAFFNAFSNFEFDILDNMLLTIGGSTNYNDYTKQSFLEPRTSILIELSDDYAVKLAYGEHHQWFRQYKFLSESFGSKELELPESTHYVFSLEYDSDSVWAWKVVLYYKEITKLVVSNPDRLDLNFDDTNQHQFNTPNYLNAGQGHTYGAELLINRALKDSWYGWISMAYSQSKRFNTLTKESFRYEFDTPFVLNAVLNFEINDNWQIGARFRFQSGKLYTPIYGGFPVFSPNNETNNNDVLFYAPIRGSGDIPS